MSITPGETWEYITEADRKKPVERQTVWKLRGLSGTDMRQLNNSLLGSDRSMQRINFTLGDYQGNALKLGLVGVSNFKDSAGNLTEYETVKVGTFNGATLQPSDAFFDLVSAGDQVEIAEPIINNPQLNEDDLHH